MIYVLGSINMDLVANVAKMPRAGQTMHADSFFVNPGGKGANQAVAIAKLGAEICMIGKVGTDSYGDTMRKNLSDYGVDTTHIAKAEASSGIAIILVQKGENRIILDAGANYKITTADVDNGLAAAKAGDILLMQLEVPLAIVEYALELGKKIGMINILNPAPAVTLSESILKNVDIITPNETETEIITGVAPNSEVHIALAVKKLYAMGVKNVVITLGARGSAVSVGQEITLVDAIKVKVVDTTGAGDTYVGAIAAKLQQGIPLVTAAKFAAIASSITIGRKGAAISIPTLKEVEEVQNSLKS